MDKGDIVSSLFALDDMMAFIISLTQLEYHVDIFGIRAIYLSQFLDLS